jgi:hypothetical protein
LIWCGQNAVGYEMGFAMKNSIIYRRQRLYHQYRDILQTTSWNQAREIKNTLSEIEFWMWRYRSRRKASADMVADLLANNAVSCLSAS